MYPGTIFHGKRKALSDMASGTRRSGLKGEQRGHKNAQIPIGRHNFFEPFPLCYVYTGAVCTKRCAGSNLANGRARNTRGNHEQLSPPFHDYTHSDADTVLKICFSCWRATPVLADRLCVNSCRTIKLPASVCALVLLKLLVAAEF